MPLAMLALITAYALSQFFRAFLAVLTPHLNAELGATPENLAQASGMWFLTFAAMQLPVGVALDKFGPRRTTAVLFGVGAVLGAAVFALASAPWHLTLAMGLIGIGCAPVLVATYFIFARVYSAAAFATLAGVMLGVGCIGNIASSAPLAWSLGFLGWRETVWALCALSALTTFGITVFVRDPAAAEGSASGGGLLDVLKIKAIWPIAALLFVTYAPIAGLSGLWIGPYARDVFGADVALIGAAALVVGLVLAVGCVFYGPVDRWLANRRGLLLWGSVILSAALFGLWATAGQSLWLSVGFISLASLVGANYPVLMAAGRTLLPAPLLGRGVTLLNLFSIGGAGVLQSATGRIFAANATQPLEGYRAIFLFFAFAVALGGAVYALWGDKRA